MPKATKTPVAKATKTSTHPSDDANRTDGLNGAAPGSTPGADASNSPGVQQTTGDANAPPAGANKPSGNSDKGRKYRVNWLLNMSATERFSEGDTITLTAVEAEKLGGVVSAI